MATFGDTTLGRIADLYSGNKVQARKFTGFPGGDVTSVSLCCKYSAAANWKIGIYAADGAGGGTGIYGYASYSSAPAATWSYGTGAWDRLTRIYLTYTTAPALVLTAEQVGSSILVSWL